MFCQLRGPHGQSNFWKCLHKLEYGSWNHKVIYIPTIQRIIYELLLPGKLFKCRSSGPWTYTSETALLTRWPGNSWARYSLRALLCTMYYSSTIICKWRIMWNTRIKWPGLIVLGEINILENKIKILKGLGRLEAGSEPQVVFKVLAIFSQWSNCY